MLLEERSGSCAVLAYGAFEAVLIELLCISPFQLYPWAHGVSKDLVYSYQNQEVTCPHVQLQWWAHDMLVDTSSQGSTPVWLPDLLGTTSQ